MVNRVLRIRSGPRIWRNRFPSMSSTPASSQIRSRLTRAGRGPPALFAARAPPHPPAEPFDEGPPDLGTRDRHLPLMSGGASRKGILCADDERILFLPDLHRI